MTIHNVKSISDAPRKRAGDVIQDEVNADVERRTGRPVANVARPDERFAPDDSGYDARVPEGNYEVSFVEEKRGRVQNRDVWFVRFRVTDDYQAADGHPYVGTELRMFLSAIPENHPPRPGWAIVSAYLVATERRPPRHLWRIKPSRFLANCRFDARVRDVSKDSRGVRRPEAGIYSRIYALVNRVAGVPPCMVERERT
jgi:hypothetical protein